MGDGRYQNKGIGKAAFKGGSTGFRIGKFFGPQAAALGAFVGGAIGGLGALSKMQEEEKKTSGLKHLDDQSKFYAEGGYEKWGTMENWKGGFEPGVGNVVDPNVNNNNETNDFAQNVEDQSDEQPTVPSTFSPQQENKIKSVFGPTDTYGSMFNMQAT